MSTDVLEERNASVVMIVVDAVNSLKRRSVSTSRTQGSIREDGHLHTRLHENLKYVSVAVFCSTLIDHSCYIIRSIKSVYLTMMPVTHSVSCVVSDE
jgi:hypothetical protein